VRCALLPWTSEPCWGLKTLLHPTHASKPWPCPGLADRGLGLVGVWDPWLNPGLPDRGLNPGLPDLGLSPGLLDPGLSPGLGGGERLGGRDPGAELAGRMCGGDDVILAGDDGDDVIRCDVIDDTSLGMPPPPALPTLALRLCCCCWPPGDDVILTGRGGDDITLAGLCNASSSDVSYMGFHVAGMLPSAKAGPPATQPYSNRQ
jgi:hypothetical protein